MTIVVGFVSKDGIAFGSDSQMTQGASKALNSKKIFTIKFPCPNMTSQVLIAQSGDVELASLVLERMQEIATDTQFDNKSVPVVCLRRAIREIKKELLEAQGSENAAPLQKEEFFYNKTTDFLIGYYYTKENYHTFEPHFYSLNFSLGIETKVKNNVGILGSGADLARFLIKLFNFQELTLAQATVAGIYIINRVKDDDLYCSGDIQMACIRHPIYKRILPLVENIDSAHINDMVAQLTQQDPNICRAFTAEIDKAIDEIIKKQNVESVPSEQDPAPPQ